MDLLFPTKIKEILLKHQTKPSKGLGQNFLIDKNVLQKIIKATDLNSTDVVLEVGPGIGVLTQELAKRAGKIIAIEKDETMIEILKETMASYKNIEVISGDILEANIPHLAPGAYKVVANIPYYLTSPLIRKFLESQNPPQEMVLMIQKEVAQRICAKPGKMSLLAVSVQFYADATPDGRQAKIISYVSKNCFWPAPKVDSAIIKIIPQKNADKKVDAGLFFKVVKSGFSQPRKQLVGNLSKGLALTKEQALTWLLENGIKPTQRAETLTVEDWSNLANSLTGDKFLDRTI